MYSNESTLQFYSFLQIAWKIWKMMYDVAFASNLIPLILSVILLRNVEAKDGDIEGQWKGWKTNGNGYLVYKATTSFETTDQITIKGTFSTLPNIGVKNMLIAADDGNVPGIYRNNIRVRFPFYT